jgi:uncharacterized protein (TIGR03435 family)
MRTEWRNVLGAAAMMGIAWVAYAQPEPTFEVSLVSGRGAGNSATKISRTPQRIAFRAARVGDIMAFAYGFPLDRIERRPQWMYDDVYDVAVNTAAPAGLAEQKLMLQSLLEKRFGLAVHRVTNESWVYYLVPGAKVNLTATQEPDAEDSPGFYASGRICVGRHVSMADLAAWLNPQMQLPVVDKTGITGLFAMEIPRLPVRGGAEGAIRAVRNALGLDLELHRGTAESLIIDHVEKLKEN